MTVNLHEASRQPAPHDEVAALNAENARLSAELAQARAQLERDARASRAAAADVQRLRDGERASGEKLHLLNQELKDDNRELLRSNAELDRRVAERTAELAQANNRLAEINRELERRVEQEVAAREAAQSALFRQQKLEALGQLTGGVAHDFNNLLTVVMSGLHMLRRTSGNEERREQLMDRVEQAVRRGAELTHRLLAFGRRQSLRPEPLDLPDRIAELRELLSHSLRGDLRIETQVPADLWPIEVDHGSLEMALLNLAVNARDAMPHGGVVTLAAANRRVVHDEAAQLDVPRGDYVALSVIDRGTGMTPEVLARVFEPFFTTKPEGSGSGLGLAHVYGFARQSGGTALVQSEPGEGAAVTMLLPRSHRGASPPAQEPESAAVPAGVRQAPRGAAILVVEDDDEVAALVMDLLGQFGYAAQHVAGADAALGALSNGHALDMVFADVLLGSGASGIDLAHEVQRRRPGVPIVLTSGGDASVIENMGRIEWPLLRKPFPPEALRQTIAAALTEQAGKVA